MTAGPRKQRIGAAFGAAVDYDRHASVQRVVARRLAEMIVADGCPPEPRILEIGCGTGFLGAELTGRIEGGRWLLTDIAGPMVERCRARLGSDPRLDFAVLDGEAPQAAAVQGPFDLIASSLAAQWFVDLPAALDRLAGLLKPGGRLAVATLASGTFAQWRQAHTDLALACGAPEYPTIEALGALRPGGLAATIAPISLTEQHADAAAFLRSLKAIGAGTPRPGRRPLSTADLRRVMRCFEAGGSAVTYQAALCLFTRPAA